MDAEPETPDDRSCAVCGAPVIPFGTFAHIFLSEDVGFLCTQCARTIVPEQVELTEAMEARAKGLGGGPQSG
jgi:hypothetical protein